MVPETAPEAAPGGWDAALNSAFGVLLDGEALDGEPLDGEALDGEPIGGTGPAAARYGVYYASDSFDEFLFPRPWATPDGLVGREPVELPDEDGGGLSFSPWAWRFDLGGSLFVFDAMLLDRTGPWGEDGHKGARPFGDAFVADLRAVATAGESDELLVRGAELGPLLGRHGVDLTDGEAKKLNCWLTVLLRVATDGGLDSALRAATFTGRGPGHLVAVGDMSRARSAEAGWEERLGAVAHPGLRDHLRMLHLAQADARSEGGFRYGGGRWPWADLVTAVGCSVVAGWGFGESQAGCAVVRLPEGEGGYW
ncbi:hypothetical protein AB0D49_39725 [Streptomyces sp. NPDC048290]|uniref:hypothetical protein n=1 Tax=Streptomyces sp. NPDC048290 TaxID=3155811 RepID=UPI00343B364C